MRYLKLFESFNNLDLDIVEDEILYWLDTGQAETVVIKEFIRIYAFKDLGELDSARVSLKKRGYRSYKSKWKGQDCLIIFRPELEKFLDDKLGDSEVYPYRDDKDLLIWKKAGEVRANQDLKNEVFYVKYNGIWSVFRFSMEYLDIQAFISGWLEERYKLGGLTPLFEEGFDFFG